MGDPAALLQAALDYAARGWPVFPCDPRIDAPGAKPKRSKAPLVPGADKDGNGKPIPRTGGLWRATTDAAQIRAWWTRWPKALIAVPTGAACGAFVVDFDPDEKNGTLEDIALRLIGEVGELPPGPVSETQSGGRHLWFALPPGEAIPPPRGGLLPGIDVRGDGGYVIVPPSMMANGRAYRWLVPPAALDPAGVAMPAPTPELLDFVLRRGKWAREASSRGATNNVVPISVRAAASIAAPPGEAPRGPGGASSGGASKKRGGEDFFHNVNSRALAALDRWARRIFPSGRLEPGTGAWRVSSRDLGRALEEDISIHPSGIRDFGTEKPMTAIDVVIEHGGAGDAAAAALWLCEALGVTPESLGWRGASSLASRGGATRLSAGSPAPPHGGTKDATRGSRGTAGNAAEGGAGGSRVAAPGEATENTIDPDVLDQLAGEPLNDLGNARRLIGHFGGDMIHVREIGVHAWAGTHWESEGGDEAAMRWAHVTSERIALEAPLLPHTKAELDAIAADEALSKEDRALGLGRGGKGAAPLFDGQDEAAVAERREQVRDIIAAGKAARGALRSRQQKRRQFSIASGNGGRLAAMVEQAMPYITVPPEAIDADPVAINLKNGTLRLVKTKVPDPECPDPKAERLKTVWSVRLDPHRREDRLAKLMPADYDPKATAPKWLAFMERFQPNPAPRRFLQQFHGYALTGLMGAQVFVFNYGSGANGKSTFMETVARVMGPYAQVLPAEALAGDMQRRGDQATPEFARLPGARLVRAAELPRGQSFRESTIKMLTGGEPLLVRHLHHRFFEMRPVFKAIGSGNDKPSIGGVDEGIWRRMKLVPWPVTIPAEERKPMEQILRAFEAERSGILNWLLEGLVDYLENGLVTPEEISTATADYRADMDPVGEFAEACVEKTANEKVTARAMYEAYTAWCHANSVKPFSERRFSDAMATKGYAKERGRIREYLNVRLINVPQDPDRAQQARFDMDM